MQFPINPEEVEIMNKLAIIELEREKEILADLMPKLGKHKIRELRKCVDSYMKQRFQMKNKIPKYGSLNKGFTELQLQTFLHAVDKPKYNLLFSYMAFLGLRIGEAVKVNIKDIDFQSREIRIHSEKTHVLDVLIVPLHLFQQTEAFVNQYRKQIENAQGYLFFKDLERGKRVEPYVESNYVRKLFTEYAKDAGLREVYDVTEEADGRVKRRLFLLTTHSLRHYAISHFARQTNGNLILTSKFARHLAPSTTTTYIHTEKEELYREIEKAFSN